MKREPGPYRDGSAPQEGYRLAPALAQDADPVWQPAARKKRRRPAETALMALSLATVVLLALLVIVLGAVAMGVYGFTSPKGGHASPPSGSFSVVSVQGTIAQSSTDAFGVESGSYQHKATVEYIKSLTKNEGDKGILLYLDTPGGSLYESDELYRALAAYHEETGRPIWAYMASTCASGGYWASMAAQHLVANYNTTTGSIGVYIALTDTSGLYEKLGVDTVLVRSGSNKGVGTAGVPITEKQRAVYQESVDEGYERFVQLVAQGRGMQEDEARALSDGRTYTAKQALAKGLVDELSDWDAALEAFKEESGGTAYYPSFGGGNALSGLLGEVKAALPQGEAEAILSRAEKLPQGVPLVYAPELAR